jgi:hypothetical protein
VAEPVTAEEAPACPRPERDRRLTGTAPWCSGTTSSEPEPETVPVPFLPLPLPLPLQLSLSLSLLPMVRRARRASCPSWGRCSEGEWSLRGLEAHATIVGDPLARATREWCFAVAAAVLTPPMSYRPSLRVEISPARSVRGDSLRCPAPAAVAVPVAPAHGSAGILPVVGSLLRRRVVLARAGSPRHHGWWCSGTRRSRVVQFAVAAAVADADAGIQVLSVHFVRDRPRDRWPCPVPGDRTGPRRCP